MTELDQWTEAVALATLNDLRARLGWPALPEIPDGFQDADEWRAQARAAVLALAPLVAERCADEVEILAWGHARAGGQMTEERAVAVEIECQRPTKSSDLDSRTKAALDALKGLAWEDDRQVVDLRTRWAEIKGCRITVRQA